jgi:two-component system, LytTR family, response regulator LytT
MSERLLIVEDEPLVRQRLERLCREILGKGARIHTADCVEDAAELLRTCPIDLLVLDLNLRGKNGFAVMQQAAACAFHTIVVSAYTEQALEAFAHGVLDFVPKPFTRERLTQALDRARGLGGATRALRHLGVWRGGDVQFVEVTDVCCITADGDYSLLQLRDGRRLLHDKSLDRLESLLPTTFHRVHRSHLANLDYAERLDVQSGSRYTLHLRHGLVVPVGRSRVEQLRNRLA